MPSIRSRAARCLATALCIFAVPCVAQATIRYSISLSRHQENLLHVAMTVPGVERELIVSMPAWNALYQLRDFAHRVGRVRAFDPAGHSLPVVKSGPQTWHVAASGTVSLDYSILWDEPGPFSSEANSSHVFLNFAEVLFYAPTRRAEEVRVDFADVPSSWRIAVALDSAGSTTSFTAPGYDALVDAPAELGTFEQFSLDAGEARVDVVVHAAPPAQGGRPSWSRERLTDEIRRIVTTETALMRDVPFRRFLFIFHFGLGGSGGMEHANSTAIALTAGSESASVTAHEFFHLWNVKRIRPQSLEPVDFSRAQPSSALWFAEGVTSTIAAYTMVRSGLWTRERFYSDLAAQIEQLETRPAREWQSAEESSLDAWFEKYPLYRLGSFSISYYNKGQLLGILLDILLREKTANRAGLDDLLRDLNQRYAKKGLFYEDSAGICAAAIKLAGPGSRPELEDFFRRYVSGTDELPFDNYLTRAGLELRISDQSFSDPGFALAGLPFGATGVGTASEGLVAQSFLGGAAERAGLSSGDLITAVNDKPVPPDFALWLDSRSPGTTLRLRIRRREEEKDITLVVGRRNVKVYAVREDSRAKGKGTLPGRIREGLLTGSTDPQ